MAVFGGAAPFVLNRVINRMDCAPSSRFLFAQSARRQLAKLALAGSAPDLQHGRPDQWRPIPRGFTDGDKQWHRHFGRGNAAHVANNMHNIFMTWRQLHAVGIKRDD